MGRIAQMGHESARTWWDETREHGAMSVGAGEEIVNTHRYERTCPVYYSYTSALRSLERSVPREYTYAEGRRVGCTRLGGRWCTLGCLGESVEQLNDENEGLEAEDSASKIFSG